MDVKVLFFTEMVEESVCLSTASSAIAGSISNNNNLSCSVLMQKKVNTETDVYVNRFYEEVVPEYSDSTYKKHFRLSRRAMNVSAALSIYKQGFHI